MPATARDKKEEVKARNYEVRMTTADKFDQADIEIQVNDTVTWINDSAKKHSVTSDEGSEIAKPAIIVLSKEFSKRVTFEEKGKFSYHCKFHAGMKGAVTVK